MRRSSRKAISSSALLRCQICDRKRQIQPSRSTDCEAGEEEPARGTGGVWPRLEKAEAVQPLAREVVDPVAAADDDLAVADRRR